MNQGVAAKYSDEHITSKSTETPPSSRPDVENRFCAAKDMGSTSNPRKNTEDLKIGAEERNKKKLAKVKAPAYEYVAMQPTLMEQHRNPFPNSKPHAREARKRLEP